PLRAAGSRRRRPGAGRPLDHHGTGRRRHAVPLLPADEPLRAEPARRSPAGALRRPRVDARALPGRHARPADDAPHASAERTALLPRGRRRRSAGGSGEDRGVAMTGSRPHGVEYAASVLHQDVRFCTTDDGVRIAFATAGKGPPLVRVANWLTHLELEWGSTINRHWLTALAGRHRLVRHDPRGSGLSERQVASLELDDWVEDLRAVVDEVGLDRFPLLGLGHAG